MVTKLSTQHDWFSQLCNQLVMRHTKSLVRNEIDVPMQKRYVITMPLSAVEEQHYQELFATLASECGLDAQGRPIRDGWDPNDSAVKEAMRRALDCLRQTALHPHLGRHNRSKLRGLGQKVGGSHALRTLSEVLDTMIVTRQDTLGFYQRRLLFSNLRRGQVLARLEGPKNALKTLESTLETVSGLVQTCRADLEHELENTERGNHESFDDRLGLEGANGNSRERAETAAYRVGEARRQLRTTLTIKHTATFFCANLYFMLRSQQDPDSDEAERYKGLEVEAYSRAKAIRKEVLNEVRIPEQFPRAFLYLLRLRD